MNFHLLRVLPKRARESAEVTAQAGARLPAKVIKVRKPVPAAVSVPALKAVRCLCRDVSPKSFAKNIIAVNVAALEIFEDGAEVTAEALAEKGIVKKACDGIKILGNGSLTKKLTVKANAFSESAKQKIEAAGGKAEVI